MRTVPSAAARAFRKRAAVSLFPHTSALSIMDAPQKPFRFCVDERISPADAPGDSTEGDEGAKPDRNGPDSCWNGVRQYMDCDWIPESTRIRVSGVPQGHSGPAGMRGRPRSQCRQQRGQRTANSHIAHIFPLYIVDAPQKHSAASTRTFRPPMIQRFRAPCWACRASDRKRRQERKFCSGWRVCTTATN